MAYKRAMRLRPTYSLRSLLVIITGLILTLGYPFYWRHKIRSFCAELHAQGHIFAIPSDWRDYLWQRPPIVGTMAYENRSEVIETGWFHPERKRNESHLITDRATIKRLKSLEMVRYPKHWVHRT